MSDLLDGQLTLFWPAADALRHTFVHCAHGTHRWCPAWYPGCGWQGWGRPLAAVPDHACDCACHRESRP